MDIILSNSWFRDSVQFDKAAANAANVPGDKRLDHVGGCWKCIDHYSLLLTKKELWVKYIDHINP